MLHCTCDRMRGVTPVTVTALTEAGLCGASVGGDGVFCKNHMAELVVSKLHDILLPSLVTSQAERQSCCLIKYLESIEGVKCFKGSFSLISFVC